MVGTLVYIDGECCFNTNGFIDKQYLSERRKIRYLKRCLQSKGTTSSKRHLKKLRKRERNISKAMSYKAASALLNSTSASIIVLEDLRKIKHRTSKTKKGFKRTKHNNAMGQVPFYQFKEILTYKATLVGKQVVSVSPMYTSQTDCRTNKRDASVKDAFTFVLTMLFLMQIGTQQSILLRRANTHFRAVNSP